ncbi:MAG: M23 family metallopeptidase [Cyanomargarita calcarea GSE-NOS-MK-12-04C]|jgi:lysostaphin|uniref:M23 family metallopeptidase n=1 Tax=Cyanomargarita calcarea GSE-NOS-MK-12-04C TaxID=2839659 RepID=A0A951QPD5_9CYAN|nr:M23 family metallopeptidase [Cyanomargarita calcarea GSE-NOS-MK-12-04C]
MKKLTISRFLTYGLIGSISFAARSALPQTANNSVSSTFIWPSQGILSQGFRKNQHEGIDIAGAVGTPVVAAASGTVIKAGWDDWGLGNSIEIRLPNGSVTVYGHNSRLLVRKGQEVNQGQAIALMGSTGNSSGSHLHFEVHPNGRLAVDPISFLPGTVAGKIPQLITDNGCNGVSVIEGQTQKVSVKVCQENGQLFYIGQLKKDPNKPVKLRAFNIGTARYRADNGSFSYFISPHGVEVWRNGRKVSSDIFDTSKHS